MALKPLNSVGGFSVGEIPANVILANSDIFSNRITVNTFANLGGVANLYIGGGSNGQVLQTDGSGNLSWSSSANINKIQNGNSNVTIPDVNGNVYINANTGTDQQWNFTTTGNTLFPATGTANLGNLVTANFANFTNNIVVQGNIANANNISITNNLDGNTANFSGNLVSLNANLGNLITANFANFANDLEVQGNIANANNISVTNNITSNTSNVNNNLYVGGNIAISNSVPTNGILTDNLYYSNGSPWDLQEAAGANTEIQYNDGSNNFGASNAFTFDYVGNVLTVNGNAQFNNANLGNLATANYVNVSQQINGNVANFSGNLTATNANLGNLATANFVNVSSNINVTDTMQAGNVRTDNLLYANGNPWDLQEAAGANTEIQYNDGSNNFGASANFTYDYVNSNLTVVGNIIATGTFVGNLQGNITISAANTTVLFSDDGVASGNTGFTYNKSNNHVLIDGNLDVNYSINATNLTSGLELSGNTANFTGNINSALNANLGNLVTANFVDVASNVTTNNLTVNSEISGNTANFTGNINSALNANLGNLVTANFVKSAEIYNNSSNVRIDYNSNVTVSVDGYADIFTVSTLGANVTGTLGVSGNITSLNADLGNLATANFVNVSSNTTTNNLTVNLELSGNTANFSGNVITPNLTVNLELSGNTANFTGNVVAANFIGSFANGNSNVKVYQDANVEITVSGSPNTATFASTGLYVVGQINTTAGNMLSNGNITANSFLNSANANVTGQAELGSVLTSNITATSSSITISAAGANNNIILSPTGSGNVTVGLHNITQVANPVNPNDAATKEYVDNISQGLYIHPAANVTSTSNLNASYLNGGTPLTVTTISGSSIITFSTNHGLSTDSDIEFTNSFNGITAGEGYFVFSIPAPNQITIKNGYFGAEITTLTDGTGLTQPALGEAGIGATLTNAGTQDALTIDSILMTVGARVLVQGQTNQTENGIYEVTTVGTISTNWVLTRATDGNSYAPKSDTQLCAGSYFFVMQGSQYAGSSFVLTAPPGEIHFGTSNIVFSQFGQSGSYTAGNGIYINGTIISANVDFVTTDIVAGNIVVKTSANLTTPNIGDATFSSLSWNNLSNGNVTANNLSIGNIANITGNLRVDGEIQSNGNVSSNAYINGNNAYFTNFANIGGNLLADNITSNHSLSTNTANITSNLVTSNATVNLELSGNTANFSGNVVLPNLTVNLALSGNTANFSGNVVLPNLTVNLALLGNTANFTGNVVANNFSTTGAAGNISGANVIFANSFTSNGGTIDFATNNPNVQLGNVGNVHIGGGSASQYLQTDGAGNLTWTTADTTTIANGTSNVSIPVANGNVNTSVNGNANIFVVTGTGANVTGTLDVSGNVTSANVIANTANISNNIVLGNTAVNWGTLTTASIAVNQTIAQIPVTGITGIEFLIKGIDSAGAKYSVATVQAVTDGANVDYSIYGGVYLTASTGVLAVNITGGNLALQVTPSSTNSTVWTTQFRTI
jgi:hypothetical protein